RPYLPLKRGGRRAKRAGWGSMNGNGREASPTPTLPLSGGGGAPNALQRFRPASCLVLLLHGLECRDIDEALALGEGGEQVRAVAHATVGLQVPQRLLHAEHRGL